MKDFSYKIREIGLCKEWDEDEKRLDTHFLNTVVCVKNRTPLAKNLKIVYSGEGTDVTLKSLKIYSTGK